MSSDNPEYRGCLSKKPYSTLAYAQESADRNRKKFGINLEAYRCRYASHWHIGHHLKPSALKKIMRVANANS